jgi:hypothetical protein
VPRHALLGRSCEVRTGQQRSWLEGGVHEGFDLELAVRLERNLDGYTQSISFAI